MPFLIHNLCANLHITHGSGLNQSALSLASLCTCSPEALQIQHVALEHFSELPVRQEDANSRVPERSGETVKEK